MSSVWFLKHILLVVLVLEVGKFQIFIQPQSSSSQQQLFPTVLQQQPNKFVEEEEDVDEPQPENEFLVPEQIRNQNIMDKFEFFNKDSVNRLDDDESGGGIANEFLKYKQKSKLFLDNQRIQNQDEFFDKELTKKRYDEGIGGGIPNEFLQPEDIREQNSNDKFEFFNKDSVKRFDDSDDDDERNDFDDQNTPTNNNTKSKNVRLDKVSTNRSLPYSIKHKPANKFDNRILLPSDFSKPKHSDRFNKNEIDESIKKQFQILSRDTRSAEKRSPKNVSKRLSIKQILLSNKKQKKKKKKILVKDNDKYDHSEYFEDYPPQNLDKLNDKGANHSINFLEELEKDDDSDDEDVDDDGHDDDGHDDEDDDFDDKEDEEHVLGTGIDNEKEEEEEEEDPDQNKTDPKLSTVYRKEGSFKISRKHRHKLRKFIRKINASQFTWKAGITSQLKLALRYKHQVLKTCSLHRHIKMKQIVHRVSSYPDEDNDDIPESFDSREKWPDCTIINMIRNQKQCGCCWAESVAGAASDRLCIDSHAKYNFPISAVDLQCCPDCMATSGELCDGGDIAASWRYFFKYGLVSGGDYDNVGCKPFTQDQARSDCEFECTNDDFDTDYDDDLFYGRLAYHVKADVKQVQLEVMKHGSVSVAMEVFHDFFAYRGGVYVPTSDQKAGYHAVRLIGWGYESDTPYWLIANSWGTGWGEKGFFKITREDNACSILDYIYTGRPWLG